MASGFGTKTLCNGTRQHYWAGHWRFSRLGTLSFNTGWKINKYATLQGGIDNLFNKSYAEFVSKGADPSAGLQTVRVNEPGRQYWLRLQVQF